MVLILIIKIVSAFPVSSGNGIAALERSSSNRPLISAQRGPVACHMLSHRLSPSVIMITITEGKYNSQKHKTSAVLMCPLFTFNYKNMNMSC